MAQKKDAALQTEGAMKISLGAGAEFAGFSVRPLVQTPGFEPIRLDGYVNGKTFVAGDGVDHATLPPANETATIDGIPFVFPGVNYGCDHLDISRSLLREANEEGYLATVPYRYGGAAMRDPCRIQVRIPNSQYEALYVVASAEDKPDYVPVLTAAVLSTGRRIRPELHGESPARDSTIFARRRQAAADSPGEREERKSLAHQNSARLREALIFCGPGYC